MKNTALIITLLLASCGGQPSTQSFVEKRIVQDRTASSMGFVTEYEFEDYQQVNDSTFIVSDIAFNPLLKMEIKNTREWYFTTGLDSIKGKKKIGTSLMKVKGEWIDTTL